MGQYIELHSGLMRRSKPPKKADDRLFPSLLKPPLNCILTILSPLLGVACVQNTFRISELDLHCLPYHSADLGTGNPHGAWRATRLALAVDADGWHAASAVRARAWFGDELRGDTHLPVDAFRNEASRSRGSVRRRCDAAGGCGSGLSPPSA